MTRGTGLLEEYLKKRRAKIVTVLLPFVNTILDIGCGDDYYFLTQVNAKKKLGIDIDVKPFHNYAYNIIYHDLIYGLPYFNKSIDAVTILAVIEHLEQKDFKNLLDEINRVLKDNGKLIITTPNIVSKRILELMAKLSMVSKVEMDDHKRYYSTKALIKILKEKGFINIGVGYFELGLNKWAYCEKTSLITKDETTIRK